MQKLEKNDTRPRVSVVIPARDGVERLQGLLDSLSAHLPPAPAVEVTVVDDGSQPPLAGQLRGFEGRMLRLEESQGPAHARNLGAEASAGGMLFFMDADVMYTPGALEQALSIFDAEPNIGAVSFLNQPYEPSDGVVANFGAAMEHFWHAASVPEGAAYGGPSAFATRNGVVRRSVFEAVGGFDPRYNTNAMEDYDIGKRMEAVTHKVIAARPWLYHAFPTRIGRIARNYWVRTSLFVPYFARFRPPMDQTQVSGSEALLRASAAAPLMLVVMAVLAPLSFGSLGVELSIVLIGTALTAVCGYAWLIRAFLGACWRWSDGNARFVCAALGLHMMTSWFILAGGVYGLSRLVRGDTPTTLWSPLKKA